MGSFLSIIWAIWARFAPNLSPRHTIIDYDKAREFLRCSTLNDRAYSNSTFAQVFQVLNPFTTACPTIHAGFKTEVNTIMRRVSRDWAQVRHKSHEALVRVVRHFELEMSALGGTIPVEAVIRTTTMLVVCEVILGVVAEDDAVPVADEIGTLIQSLWSFMKKEPNFLEKVCLPHCTIPPPHIHSYVLSRTGLDV